MSKSLLAALGLVPRDLLPGQSFSHHSVTLSKDGAAGSPVTTSDPEITFDGLDAGAYSATGFSVLNNADGTSTATDTISAGPFVIAPDAVVVLPGSASVLGSITLSLAPAAPAP